jgi:DNA-binding NarL/FixJ family response regulator
VLLAASAQMHVSNVFTNLGLSSRAAATAYAYERRILQSST